MAAKSFTSLQNPPSFSLTKGGTNQTGVATGFASTVVTWPTTDWNSAGSVASNKHTPDVPGKYLYTASILSVDVPTTFQMFLRKNGTDLVMIGNTTGYFWVAGTATVEMNGTTDYMEVIVVHNSAGTITLDGNVIYTRFQGLWTGP